MTPERRAEVVEGLRQSAQNHHGERYSAAILTDAADELEAMGKCGFCGREVYSSLKPMCGDCAGKEHPDTVALRADLAKAKERLAAAENLRCIGPGHPDGPTCLEDGASREEHSQRLSWPLRAGASVPGPRIRSRPSSEGDAVSTPKPPTEAELKKMEERVRSLPVSITTAWLIRSNGTLIAEVRRLRAQVSEYGDALMLYGAASSWGSDSGAGIDTQVWEPANPEYRNQPGYQRAREALGWGSPDEPCDNPSCDGVKGDKTFGDAHRCFKDGRWLDDNEEM